MKSCNVSTLRTPAFLETSDDDSIEDYEYPLSYRKTRRDVLTVPDAIRSSKASKNHKLKPRVTSYDRTKSAEARTKTCMKKFEREGNVY